MNFHIQVFRLAGLPKNGSKNNLPIARGASNGLNVCLKRMRLIGKADMSAEHPKYLQDRHHFPAVLIKNLGIAGILAEQAAQ